MCYVARTIYVFCGMSIGGELNFTNAIEKISKDRLCEGYAWERWEIIMPDVGKLSPRYSLIAVKLNEFEIVLIGGHGQEGRLADILIFDTLADSCEKVVDDCGIKFEAHGN